jgi:hypothetical protein
MKLIHPIAAQTRAEKIVAALLKLNSLGKAFVDINLRGRDDEAIRDRSFNARKSSASIN